MIIQSFIHSFSLQVRNDDFEHTAYHLVEVTGPDSFLLGVKAIGSCTK
jgi:hypothetical protein